MQGIVLHPSPKINATFVLNLLNSSLKFNHQQTLNPEENVQLMKLWNREYPQKLIYQLLSDFESYLESLSEQSHILIKDDNQQIKGWYFEFIREHEKWFGLILDAGIQGKGFGSQLLNEGKSQNMELNGWLIDHNNYLKKNGENYYSPLDFYLKNGFSMIPNQRLKLDKISVVKITWKKDHSLFT